MKLVLWYYYNIQNMIMVSHYSCHARIVTCNRKTFTNQIKDSTKLVTAIILYKKCESSLHAKYLFIIYD